MIKSLKAIFSQTYNVQSAQVDGIDMQYIQFNHKQERHVYIVNSLDGKDGQIPPMHNINLVIANPDESSHTKAILLRGSKALRDDQYGTLRIDAIGYDEDAFSKHMQDKKLPWRRDRLRTAKHVAEALGWGKRSYAETEPEVTQALSELMPDIEIDRLADENIYKFSELDVATGRALTGGDPDQPSGIEKHTAETLEHVVQHRIFSDREEINVVIVRVIQDALMEGHKPTRRAQPERLEHGL